MPRKSVIKHVKRIVVKVGSSSVTDGRGISGGKISKIVGDVADIIKRGYQVVIVSSGAIAAGSASLKKNVKSLTIPEKQAFAAVGQTILMNEYRNKFSRRGLPVAQILLTEDDVRHRTRFTNASHTLETLLHRGIIPIVNENDSVAVNEIKFGDNDLLSAHVTSLINADLLILLSDVNGFYRYRDDPEPVEEVENITDSIVERAGGTGSAFGSGGMLSKIRAAELIMRFGQMMIIANAKEKNVLARIMNGERIGTLFRGRNKPLSGKKRWLALRKTSGVLILDDGAVQAIRVGKKSLLASGITGMIGDFDMGDIVEISDDRNNKIGKGIVNYACAELDKIKGKKSAEIRKILGENIFEEVIHRDDLMVY
ncbi:MAG: glutamate 5-kinase [Spirochaetes bacterium RBG_16_49_21]|nr:MAG: glutamate 5-kinase [Spirochaetes bacterium RBG_16_49_21]